MKPWFLALIVVSLAVAIAYGRCVTGGFLLDDYGILSICWSKGAYANNVKLDGQAYVRPVSWTVLGAIWQIWKSNPIPFHIGSLVVFALTGWCIWGIWSNLFPAIRWQLGLLPALLFIFWPNHGETLCWLGGYPDLFAGLFGAASLKAWMAFCRPQLPVDGAKWRRDFVPAVSGSLFALLAIASKESALPLVLAVPICCWLVRPSGWWRSRRFWFASVMTALALGGFWMVRASLIGKLVGGYGKTTPFDGGLVHLLGSRGLVEVANLYFPFARLARWIELPRTGQVFTYLIFISLLGLALTWPRGSTRENRLTRALPFATGLWLCGWGSLALIDMEGFVELFRSSLGLAYPPLMILAILGYFYFGDRLATNENLDFLEAYRLKILALGVVLWIFLYYRIATSLDQLCLVALYMVFAYSLRRARPLEDQGLWPLMAGMVLLSIASIFLVMNLPVGWDGQQERFSYFGTIFSVIAISGLIQAISTRYRQGVWTAVLVGCFSVLAWNNLRWYRVGDLANDASRLVLGAQPDSKIYFLAAPNAVDGAGLYEIGIPEMGYGLTGRSDVTTGVALTIEGCLSDDHVEAKRIEPDTYEVTLQHNRQFRHLPVLQRKEGLMFGGKDTTVQLVGRRPTDKVVVMDASGLRIID